MQNIGIDDNNCLKLFGFGSATNKVSDSYQCMLEIDHSRLAICLHFILSSVDPLANAKDWSEIRCIKRELWEGRYIIMSEVIILKEVITNG